MQLGPYRLIDRLGAGGMGEVWRAEDTRLLRPAAVKILAEKIASDADWKARFLREARTAASLNHPNIATIYAVDEHESTMYLAMELVIGTSLAELISGRSLGAVDLVRIARQIAEALSAAHEKQIVHRDIKPDNIIVLQKTVKVLDFGIAKMIGPSATEDNLTKGELILGTPYYMSPEQALGKKITTRTDIFSLGVVMFESLAGRRPFQGSNVTETVLQILTRPTPEITPIFGSASAELLQIVERCLSKQALDRPTADELVDALSHVPEAAVRSSREPTTITPLPRPAEPAPIRTQPEPARPARVMETPTPAPPPKRAAEVSIPLGVRRALVTDDDAITREILCSVLRQKGVPYDEAANGAEAIKQLKQNQYGIVFLDLLMPRIDGWGVLDFIRSKGSGDTKVYILTAFREQRLSAADQEIVAGILFKPIDEVAIDGVLQKTALAARAS